MNKKMMILVLLLLLGVSVVNGGSPRMLVLANSIDTNLAAEFFDFWIRNGVEVILTNVNGVEGAYQFDRYKDENFIVILGGPDAYDGVGEIVQEILTEDEKNSIKQVGAKRMLLKINPWGLNPNQLVVILAGSDRELTKKSQEENRHTLASVADITIYTSTTPPDSIIDEDEEDISGGVPPEIPPPVPIPQQLPGSKWSKTFGGTENDNALAIQQTNDGGYIMAGYTGSFDPGHLDVYLIKTDKEGNEIWSKAYGDNEKLNYSASSVQQTSDGGYIIAGYTQSFETGERDVYLMKTDSEGNEQWSKTFGGKGNDVAFSVQQTSDGGYIIAGHTNTNTEFRQDVYLIKTDGQGNKEWNKTFGGPYDDQARSVQVTSDGGYIIAGYSWTFGIENRTVYLIKTDAEGNEVWSKTFGDTERDRAFSVQQTSDGGYIVAGATQIVPLVEILDAYLIKTGPEGNEIWSKTFGGVNGDHALSVQQTSDGGYIIGGETTSFGAGNFDAYLVKTDAEGNEIWSKTFGGVNHDSVSSVVQTSDGGYIIAGYTGSYGQGKWDVFLIKIDA